MNKLTLKDQTHIEVYLNKFWKAIKPELRKVIIRGLTNGIDCKTGKILKRRLI